MPLVKHNILNRINALCILIVLISSCTNSASDADKQQQVALKGHASFATHTADKTGLDVANTLVPTKAFNMFTYMYFYNGAGLGAADFNNDGLVDLFFANNQQPNKLFLNKGALTFEDITTQAGIPNDGNWSTGVSIVDINNDSLPDIYVCKASQFSVLQGKNQLLVCKGIKNGVPYYADEAAKYGLNFSGLSTQAVFFDYDLDGDLDMYLLNHAPSHVGRFAERSRFLNTYDAISGDRLYKREADKYIDVTKESGIHSSAIGYGLGIAVSDINLDGWPDIYVGNDFHENDYLYINAGNGTFVDEASMRTMHTSQFTMGVDIADATNDGYPEIVSMDMLPADHYMQKRSLGEDSYDIFEMKLRYGYHPFFTRNNLQLNRRNELFSEVGLYAGIAATDWSWSCLWTDFDNDGWKDLFISNGIPKRLNDIDYVNFISNDEMQRKMEKQQLTDSDFAVVNRFPEIKLPNYFFRNNGEARFENIAANIQSNQSTFSNGAVYADLDNDGDVDIVVNNIADKALLYENTLNASQKEQACQLVLHGPASNINAIGARVVLFSKNEIRTYDKQAVHGYMSAIEAPLHIGIGNAVIDSAYIIWPDKTCEPIKLTANKTQQLSWRKGLPKFNFDLIKSFYKPAGFAAEDLTLQTGLVYEHTENLFQEFNREQLIPQMTSTQGPALAVADVNGDGLDDVFLGSARGFKNALFVQQPNGMFTKMHQPDLDDDSTCEDVDAAFADINNDRFPDLLIASGGNEFFGTSPYTAPRAYLNDGKGNFRKKTDAFINVFLTASCIAVNDFDKNGTTDIFIGARCEPFAYGKTPKSFLLKNDGTGKFTDVTATASLELQEAGLVKHAIWNDVDNNGTADLVISSHWQSINVYLNNSGTFSKKPLNAAKGWWNVALPLDANGDGKTDWIAGNMGLNSRLTASATKPLRMYVNDIDGNGTTEQILTYYIDGKEQVFAGKDDLQRQLPILKKQFLYAEDFAKASLKDIFPGKALNDAIKLEADDLANTLMLNNGDGKYTSKPLPWLAQLSTYNDAMVVQANNDNLPDVLLVGNFYDNTIQLGRYDADMGLLLINKGNGNFVCENLNGLFIPGESRKIRSVKIKNRQAYIVARNNGPAVIFAFNK